MLDTTIMPLSLDPKNWDELEQLVTRVFRSASEHYQGMDQQAVWQPASDETRQLFTTSIYRHPQSLERLEECFRNLMIRSYGNCRST